MSPTHTVRPSGSKHLDTSLEKTEEEEDDDEEEEDVEDLRRLFISTPSSSSSSSPAACTSLPSALGVGVPGEEAEGHRGPKEDTEEEEGGVGGEREEDGGSSWGASQASVELHSEFEES